MTGPSDDLGPAESAASDGARIWVDSQPVSPTWPAPQLGDPVVADGAGRTSKWLTRGIPVLAVVVLIIAVWAFGGFERREDRTTTIKPGQQFTNGAYVVSFERATIQRKKGYGDNPIIQEVVVHGMARNISSETDRPEGDWFAATDQRRSVVEEGSSVDIEHGDDGMIGGPDDLTPGLPALPIEVDFEFPESFDPDGHLSFGMTEIDYRNHSVTSTSDEKTWGSSSKGYFRVQLAVSKLPPDDD